MSVIVQIVDPSAVPRGARAEPSGRLRRGATGVTLVIPAPARGCGPRPSLMPGGHLVDESVFGAGPGLAACRSGTRHAPRAGGRPG